MADPNMDADKFVEIDGVKYKEDPEKEGEGLIGDDGELVPFEEKPEETQEEKEAREKKEAEDKKAEEDGEPPTRRSAKDHIIDRKQKKIEKLEKKKKDDEGGDDDDGEHEVTPAGQKAIDKAVDKKIGPVLQTVRTNADEQELKDVFTKYPDAKDMEKQIRKYMTNDSYKNVSVEFIYLGLAAKKIDLQKKRDKADEKAKADATGGHGKRQKKLSPIPDVRDMPDKEVDDLIAKVKTGQF